jgi:hypothetical protein
MNLESLYFLRLKMLAQKRIASVSVCGVGEELQLFLVTLMLRIVR